VVAVVVVSITIKKIIIIIIIIIIATRRLYLKQLRQLHNAALQLLDVPALQRVTHVTHTSLRLARVCDSHESAAQDSLVFFLYVSQSVLGGEGPHLKSL